MTPEERQMLAGLFERVGSTAATPRDAEAEAFINDATRAQPHAPYVLAQTVLVQQQALENASRRLAELEAQAKQAAPQQETSFLGNIGRSLFGGGQAAPPPPRSNYDASAYARQPGPDQGYQRQPAYAPPSYAPPPPQAGPWAGQQQAAPSGGGFMQSALTTAAGVAGGMVLAHSLGSLFGGGHSGGFGLGGIGSGLGGGEVVNNYYETAPDPAGQRAEDTLQDMDQDQDDAQDAYDNSGDSGGGDSGGGYDT